jgi:hypothetical protein
VTISDGAAIFTFEAQANTTVVNADDLTFAVGVDDTATAANLAAAINTARIAGRSTSSPSRRSAWSPSTTSTRTGGAITGAAATITVVDFAGGDADFGGFYTIVNVTDDAISTDRDVPVLRQAARSRSRDRCLRNPGHSADITAQSLA